MFRRINGAEFGVGWTVLVVVIFLLLQIMIWTHGCSSSTSGIGNNDQLALLGIKNTARVLGYAIGNSKATNDDEIIKGSYFLFRQGQMTEVQMTVVISQMKKMHPLAAAGALDLLAAMGGMINPDQGTVLDVSGIKPEIWDAAATAYAFGFDLGINDRQKGGRQAVIM